MDAKRETAEGKPEKETPEERQLQKYLRAARPIIYIPHFDFQTVDKMIGDAGRKVLRGPMCVIDEWSEAGGRVHPVTKSPVRPGPPMPLEEFLARYNTSQLNTDKKNYLLVLKEVHGRLAESRVVSLLQTLAWRTKMAEDHPVDKQGNPNRYRVQVVVADTQLSIPPGLEKLTTVIEILPPDGDRIGEIIDAVVKDKKGLRLAEGVKKELVEAFKGLSEFEIRQILALAAADNVLDKNDVGLIREEKRQLIKKSGLLEMVDPGDAEVGGLENLQDYVAANKDIFKYPGLAAENGVDKLKGVMIVGMPGCGKSLMAKFVAKTLDVPLLRLDVGQLMGKYVGESEHNLHRALAVATAVAPCVLWIDEIEKAFEGIGEGGGGGGAMTRMFGIFLTWMQEKTASVYVVATANRIDKLPPEFTRRGRFDEIFKVEFPDEGERLKILEVHVKKRNGGKVPAGVDVERAAWWFKDGAKYSGADIESIVAEAMKRVFRKNMAGFRAAAKKRPGLTVEEYREKPGNWTGLTTEVLVKVIQGSSSSYQRRKADFDEVAESLKALDAEPAR